MKPAPYSPRAFLQARRPEQFSDSQDEDEPALTRTLLEYQLSTLTSRSQETDFEHFALKVAQRTICPNLLPHTGPTGGGDSKVDSETYPVADILALVWHVGIGSDAAKERWAFAFSAKQEWRGKVRSDIAKLVKTGRGYTKAFFITSQLVPDKARAALEDQLSDQYSLDCRILDRTWLLDSVFEHRLEAVAIDSLRMDLPPRPQRRPGPRDVRREAELEALDGRIAAAYEQSPVAYTLVDDCIEAAILSRELEQPRTKTEAMFARASQVADRYGSHLQRVRALYQHAWTSYWWLEDYSAFLSHYDALDRLVAGTANIYCLELLCNLWNCLWTAHRCDMLLERRIDINGYTEHLLRELRRFEAQEDAPSSALQARTFRLQTELHLVDADEAESIFVQFGEVLKQCGAMLGYPLDSVAGILSELGRVFGTSKAYSDLFETLVSITAKRSGALQTARLLLARGSQHLQADQPYEAIKVLGRALVRLYTYESRDEFVRALLMSSAAFERAGLLWAARGVALSAASTALQEFSRYEKLSTAQYNCLSRLRWLELRTGRIGHVLAWQELGSAMAELLIADGYSAEQIGAREMDADVLLGALLLRTDLWELKWLCRLPAKLEAMGMPASRVALLYALGHEDEVPTDLVESYKDRATWQAFFKQWCDQVAANEIAEQPDLCNKQEVLLSSTVVGCRVSVTAENRGPCVEVGESVLAAMEALLATCLLTHRIMPEPELGIRVKVADLGERLVQCEVVEARGRPSLEVRCTEFRTSSMKPAQQREIKEAIRDILIQIVIAAFRPHSPEVFCEQLLGQEEALDRALHFTTSIVTTSNLLGETPKVSVEAWCGEALQESTLARTAPWWEGLERPGTKAGITREGQDAVANGEAVEPDWSRLEHGQVENVSVINMRLWDRAKWQGIVSARDPAEQHPPMLGIGFMNERAALEIFEEWQERFGDVDEEEVLRVSVIRNIRRSEPHSYRVCIGANIGAQAGRAEARYLLMNCRMHTMEPKSSENLDWLVREYERTGMYLLAPAVLTAGKEVAQVFPEKGIWKRELYVREAWQLGRHDVDGSAVTLDDDPLIPDGVDNAPVLELLAWRKELEARDREQGDRRLP